MYKVIELSDPVRLYLSECLTGGHRLSQLIAERYVSPEGRIYTIVPAELVISYESANDPWHGGLLPAPSPEFHRAVPGGIVVPTATTDDLLGKVISDYFKQDKQLICVVEDSVAKKTDPFMQSFDVPWVAYQDEVYYILSGATDPRKIRQVIECILPWPAAVGALTRLDGDVSSLLVAKKLSDDVLRAMAKATVTVIVAAYDREGYVLWDCGADNR